MNYSKGCLLSSKHTILLSDKGLDDETPESDAQDLTDAERTILGAASSNGGDIDDGRFELLLLCIIVNDGHDATVARRYELGEFIELVTIVDSFDGIFDDGGDELFNNSVIG